MNNSPLSEEDQKAIFMWFHENKEELMAMPKTYDVVRKTAEWAMSRPQSAGSSPAERGLSS